MTTLFKQSIQAAKTAALTAMLFVLAGSAMANNEVVRMSSRVQPAGTAEEFVNLKRSAMAPVVATMVELGAWTAPKAAAASDRDDLIKIGATRTSQGSASVQAVNTLLNWKPSPRGGLIAAMNFVSNDAFGLRAGLQIDALPGNALVRVYEPELRDEAFEIPGQRIQQLLQNNAAAGDPSAAARTWWTPAVDGDQLVIEIELPAGFAPSQVQVAVPSVLHIYQDIFNMVDDGTAVSTKINNAGTCTLDSTCFDEYARQRDAVARMHYVTADGGYLCTGTLLNDRTGSGTPYFLTANHCIASQTEASTLQTFWFYRTPSCNSRLLSSASKTLKNGAKLLYTSSMPDATLLVLNDTPPAGAVFAGWDTSALNNGAGIVGIHHPGGDMQKISFGNVVGTSACTPGKGYYNCVGTSAMTESFYRVQWTRGMTEGGSSGSGLFVNGVLTGVLSNGTASCTATGGVNNYARFDKIFPAIQQWLYPEVSGAQTGGARTAVYRFYNTQTGAHFYTNNVAERDLVINNYHAYQYENAVFHAYTQAGEGLVAVHRFYNRKTDSHVYTINDSERAAMQADAATFGYDGIAWYAKAEATSDTVQIFRFRNTQSGRYFYSASVGERDFVIATYVDLKYEGVSYNVWQGQ